MGIILKNNAKSVLSADISSTDTTIPISDTSSFPALGVNDYFYCTLESTSGAYEIVKVTQVNAASFVAVRAQESTIAIPFSTGARAELRITVQTLEDQFSSAATDEAEAVVAAAIGVTVQGYDVDTAKLDLAQTWTLQQTFSTVPVVPDDAYAVGWNGSFAVPTKNAIYDKINTIDVTLSQLDTSVVLKGTWDASAGTFPGSGVAQAGWSYIVSIGGTVDGTTFAVGDRIIAILDNASTSTYANNWFKADYTDAVSSVAGKTGAVTIQVADITDMTANGRSLVSAANYAAMRTLLDLEAGVDFVALSGGTYSGDVSVPDEAYGVGWNGSLEVPTKNAVYDKIEAMVQVTNGDKGDITVSAAGATWTIDNNAVTYAKMQDISATSRILGRITAGSGDVEELTATNVKTILALAQADISGLTTASSPQFTAIELGAATDTTLARSSAGNVTIEGNIIYRAGGTDVPLADGGTGASLTDPNADRIMFWDDSAGAVTWLAPDGFGIKIDTTTLYKEECWMIACSDESTTLTTGTAKATFVFPYNVTVISVGCSVNTAGTGLTIDINESLTSILSTKLTLDSGEKTSLTAATQPVISDASITAGNEVSIDIDTASGTSKGLKVWMIVRRTS